MSRKSPLATSNIHGSIRQQVSELLLDPSQDRLHMEHVPQKEL